MKKRQKKEKIKVDSIQDYTAENVHIEIKLPRGQYSNDYVDRLYALTNCEVTLHANAVVILDNKPQQLNINQIVEHHTTYFKQTVEQDLNNEKARCLKKIFYKTLEQIFIENKVYRELETLKDNSKMHQVVYDGVTKFLDKSFPDPNEDDIKHLCELPIRRISRYDREKNDIDIQQLRDELAVIEDKLTHLTQTTIDILNDILKKYGKQYPRCTEISEFDKVQARVLDQRKIKVGVNLKDGFVGKKINGPDVLDAYFHDKIVLFYNDGSYMVTNPEDKVYVHTKTKKVICVDVYRAENEYSIAYRSANDRIYANRFKIPGFIANKPYPFIPKGSSLLAHTTDQHTTLIVDYVVFPRMKIPQEKVEMMNIPLRSPSTKGIQISKKKLKKVRFKTYKRNHAANTE